MVSVKITQAMQHSFTRYYTTHHIW